MTVPGGVCSLCAYALGLSSDARMALLRWHRILRSNFIPQWMLDRNH